MTIGAVMETEKKNARFEISSIMNEVGATAAEASYEPNKFDILCDTVNSSLMMLDQAVHEFFDFKDELLKHALPPQLLLQLTLISAKVFRSFSDLCVPVGELTRLVKLHSVHLEEAMAPMKRLQECYVQKQSQLNIALKRIEMMATEEERISHEKRLNGWLKLFIAVMSTRSHGRRWKFRIEPLKAKIKRGFNPYASDDSEEGEEEEDVEETDEQDGPSELNDNNMLSDNSMFLAVGKTLSSRKNSRQFLSPQIHEMPVVSPPPPPPPPRPITVDSETWTGEPRCQDYILVQLFRPKGVAPEVDICCTLSLEDQFFSSQVFTPKPPNSSVPLPHQDFSFILSDEAAMTLQPHPLTPLRSSVIPKLSIAVYPKNITADMAAHASLELKSLTLTPQVTTLVPPVDTGEPFEVNWTTIAAGLQATPPVDYPLHCTVEDEDPPAVPLVCHRVKVIKHAKMNSETSTPPWDRLLADLGYSIVQKVDLQSCGVSAVDLEPVVVPSPVEQEDHMTQEEVATIVLKHTEELERLQDQYENKIEALSNTLAKVRADKAREIEQLEQALVASEKSKGKQIKSPSEIRKLVARKQKPRLNQRLPDWGSSLPDNFYERLQLFAEESVQKHGELTERIRRRVREVCEKQMATLHRLAPPLPLSADSAMEDVSLPALFMPTPRNLVFNPRAHQYFHPTGTSDIRVTQPPSVFKLPSLPADRGIPTLNLFHLSQQYAQRLGRPEGTYLYQDSPADPEQL